MPTVMTTYLQWPVSLLPVRNFVAEHLSTRTEEPEDWILDIVSLIGATHFVFEIVKGVR